MIKANVVQFRRGKRTFIIRHFLIEVDGVDTREKAKKFVGKEVVWTSSADNKIKGKIASAHGNKGVLRVIFEKGLPGQAIGTDAEILDKSGDKK